ncbi:MAG: hypothetical protein BA871_16140 [Desulfuromonadales bacterium C00003096]|nr:MAG: hypothetical protein BA871_16140 [Desulfuromonadales bacterium C00003096]
MRIRLQKRRPPLHGATFTVPRRRTRFQKLQRFYLAPQELVDDYADIAERLDVQLRNTSKRLKEIHEPELAQTVDSGLNHLLTIPGISVKSAAAIIGEVGNIEQFPTAKHLIGYVGCHPRFNSSGTKEERAFTSKAGNKRLRRILWQCTIVAIRHNPLVRAHHEAKLTEGKRKMVAIGHCMAKLVRIVWAIQTYNEPFDAAGGTRLAAVQS